MCRRPSLFLIPLVLLALATPARAQVQVTCTGFTLNGSYVMTLGGVDAAGQQSAKLAFIDVAAANGAGQGQFSGVLYFNERGGAKSSKSIVGSHEIFSNCIVHFVIPDATLSNTVTGFVLDFGDLVVLSSVFDPAAQLTGVMRKVH